MKPEHADDAFSGEGGLHYASRWNLAGVRIVYTAQSMSLATLEILVHLRNRPLVPNFVAFSCSFPDAIVEELPAAKLPANWSANPAPAAVQQLGMQWIDSGSSAVLRVPSAIIESEFNYLLNPEHEDFRSVQVGPSRPFHLDVRLII